MKTTEGLGDMVVVHALDPKMRRRLPRLEPRCARKKAPLENRVAQVLRRVDGGRVSACDVSVRIGHCRVSRASGCVLRQVESDEAI